MKPHFKLRLDGSLLPMRDQALEIAMRRVRAQDDGPLHPAPGVRSIPMRRHQRYGSAPEYRLRRQIIRAFGTLGAFVKSTGLSPDQLGAALNPAVYYNAGRPVAALVERLGLQPRLQAQLRREIAQLMADQQS